MYRNDLYRTLATHLPDARIDGTAVDKMMTATNVTLQFAQWLEDVGAGCFEIEQALTEVARRVSRKEHEMRWVQRRKDGQNG